MVTYAQVVYDVDVHIDNLRPLFARYSDFIVYLDLYYLLTLNILINTFQNQFPTLGSWQDIVILEHWHYDLDLDFKSYSHILFPIAWLTIWVDVSKSTLSVMMLSLLDIMILVTFAL